MSDVPNPVPQPALTRRRFIQGSAVAGFSAFLAACGTTGTGGSPSAAPPTTAPSASVEPPTPAPPQTPSTELNFANWPLYIDTDEDDETKHKTLEDFTAKYGTKVNYSEVINDNNEFFGTIRAPLEAGQDTGWDIIVLTQWMAGRLVRLGWLEKFDPANVPNYTANLEDAYKAPDFDPTNEFHAPWQAGMTGLGFDKAVTGDITSSAALWDPKWKGRVTFLSEMRDTMGIALQKLGHDPEQVTTEQYDEAIAEVKTAVDAEIVRAFTGNEYAEDLVSGNVVLAMAWSGDIIQKKLEKETLEWVPPDEGGMLWYDCMLIPKGAAHKYTAELMIDFVYDPAIAAQIEAWVNYICPVKGAQPELAKIDEELAANPLIFPTPEILAKVKRFKSLTEEEERDFDDKFSELIGV
ncbi:MAG TPA: extracellular solute-binding protein [Candidatus Limnocylindrales bacterium]|jgi:spermidine/putrescine transport system substrate-binding protein|nr:extracellular solute-binding protein [Candidatus Limnocylindrales bacterium]